MEKSVPFPNFAIRNESTGKMQGLSAVEYYNGAVLLKHFRIELSHYSLIFFY